MKASDLTQTSGVQTCFVMNSPEAPRTVVIRLAERLGWRSTNRAINIAICATGARALAML
jgi:hypothetical protein